LAENPTIGSVYNFLNLSDDGAPIMLKNSFSDPPKKIRTRSSEQKMG